MNRSRQDYTGGAYRFPAASVTSIVLANFFPVFGVLYWGWLVFDILLFQLLEIVVIGVFFLPQVIICRGPGQSNSTRRTEKIGSFLFFLMTYTLFPLFYVEFLKDYTDNTSMSIFDAANSSRMRITFAALLLSHGLSFFVNFIGRGRFRTASAMGVFMLQIFLRVYLMVVVMMVGSHFVYKTGNQLWTLIILVVVRIGLDLLYRLGESGPRVPSDEEALMNAAFGGRIETIQALIDKGVNINALAPAGESALMLAAMRGHIEIVQLLLDNGSEVNVRLPSGQTALIFAAMNGHARAAEFLIQSGADVNAKDNNVGTALMGATKGRHTEIVRLLKNAGAKE